MTHVTREMFTQAKEWVRQQDHLAARHTALIAALKKLEAEMRDSRWTTTRVYWADRLAAELAKVDVGHRTGGLTPIAQEAPCDCGSHRPESARHGHAHLPWCAWLRSHREGTTPIAPEVP